MFRIQNIAILILAGVMNILLLKFHTVKSSPVLANEATIDAALATDYHNKHCELT